MCRCCNSQLFYGLSPLQRGQGSSLFTQHDREVTSLSRGTDMMSQSQWIHRSAPPEKAVLQAPRQGNPYQNGYGHLRQASAFTLSRGHILPDSSSLELTRLTQPGPFPQLLCFASPLDSFQLCLAHSYCNGLHSGGSMSSLFCCQGFRWMAVARGSSGGEVKGGRAVGLPPECRTLQCFSRVKLLLSYRLSRFSIWCEIQLMWS